jgi:hypothetical protein
VLKHQKEVWETGVTLWVIILLDSLVDYVTVLVQLQMWG